MALDVLPGHGDQHHTRLQFDSVDINGGCGFVIDDVSVTPAQDFTVAVDPDTETLGTTDSAVVAISGTAVNDPSPIPVTLYASVSPPIGGGGLSTSLDAATVLPGGSTNLTLNTVNAVPGEYVVNVSGTAGFSRSTNIHVTVSGAADSAQPGLTKTVNTTDDHNDGVCGTADCTLREAIIAHNAGPAGQSYPIVFAGTGVRRYSVTGELPALTRPATIAGPYTPGPTCATPVGGLQIEIDGSNIDGGTHDGLAFTGDGAVGSSIYGLIIDGFSGNAIRVTGSSGESGLSYLRIGCNVIGTAGRPNTGSGIYLDNVNGGWIGGEIDPGGHPLLSYDNVITHNGDNGITYVWTSSSAGRWGVRADSNVISDNGDLAIDLGADGPTPNDALDADEGANDLNNAPVLFRAESGSGLGAGIAGQINTSANTRQDVTLYLADTCDPNGSPQGGTILGTLVSGSATFGGVGPTDSTGVANFTLDITGLPVGKYVTATATNDRSPGSTSEYSNCVRIGSGNDSWPNARDITNTEGSITDVISYPGQSRWYKVAIAPGEQVSATVANGPTSNVLLAFKDIQQAYDELQAASLTAQTAESSGGSTTGKFSGGTNTKFSGGTNTKFSGGTNTKFSGGTGAKFAGDLGFSADAFSGGTGTRFAAGTGSRFSPVETANGTGTKFAPESYSGAQVSSLVAFNDTPGLAPKSVVANTWNNDGYYYIRVSAQDGASNPRDPFALDVAESGGACGSLVDFSGTALGPLPSGTNLKSVILLDSSRIAGTPDEKSALANQLAAFAARSEVGGVVVDLKNVARLNDVNDVANDAAHVVNDLNDQADKYPACPYAKNLLANAIKGVVDSYRADSPNLAYVVLVGGDSVIPFFRYPDEAEIAPETAFYPPVAPTSPSEASLRLNYVLSQDAYGAKTKVNVGVSTFPVTDLAVGRLVETASEASGMLDAYLNHTNGGVVSTPTSSLATGYDFMADTASSVASDFVAGIGTGTGKVNDALINETWTAGDLTSKLLGSQRHDLVFLAGHFSANRALAADQNTTISTTDLVSSRTDFQNAIVFSQGCHSGYGIVDDQGIAGVTQPLDWAQAFSQKRATLIAGTGYQYGDTDLIQYSELIYASFAKELRTGPGAVSVGQALLAAKKDYLRATPDIRGTDTKSLLESTLYGLPMLSVNLPGTRLVPPPDPSLVAVTPVPDGPGKPVASGGLGLQTAPVNLTTTGTLTPNPAAPGPGAFTWLSGPNGVAVQPYQPVLPLIVNNVTVSGQTLRGVGFMGGSYGDTGGVKPLVSVPATEQKGTQPGFSSPTFYPAGIASVSYFDALGNGATRLLVTPVQHKADSATTATRRVFSGLQLQLFYSSFTGTKVVEGQTFRPSLAAAPSIVDVTATESGQITFDAHVSGDPSAGIQKVWVTYTGFDNTWTSLDLNVDPLDETHFTRTLPVPSGHTGSQLLFMIQAVSGTGLVSADTNDGAFYAISPTIPPVQGTTTVTFDTPSGTINPPSGTFGGTVTFAATLHGAPLPDGKPIVFSLGGNTLTGITAGGGHASVSWPLIQAPSSYIVSASFAGDTTNGASYATAPFAISKASTSLTLNLGPQSAQDSGIVATLKDSSNNLPLDQRSVFFAITSTTIPSNSIVKPVITKSDGTASVGKFPLPPGTYTVKAYFLGVIPTVSTAANPLVDEAYQASESGTQNFTTTAKPVLTLAFTAASKDFDGTTAATISDCTLIGVVGTPDVHCAFTGATASFADNYPGTFKTVTGNGFTLTGAAASNYTFNSTAYTTADIDAVDPGNVLGAVVAADADFKALEDGFDVLFSKGASTSVMTLRNTEPGTFHYLLSLDNESGIALNSGNGAASTSIITIPGVPANGVNLTIPASATGLTNPAFTVQGWNPVRVHPDEGHDWDHDTDLPAQVWYAYLSDTPSGLGDCLATGVVWRSGQPADGAAPKCLKVTGFDLPKRKKARIDINLEFRLKNTPNWLTSQNPSVNFRAGFPFKSVTSVTLDSRWGSMAGTYPGNQITGVIGVGQSVTAVGGFVFDTNGGGISDAIVRVYNSAPSTPNMCTTTGQVAAYTTMPDGFYFISQKGVNDASTQATGPNPLPSGVQYYIAICSVPGVGQPFWPARSIDHKLGNKEFDGEDFYVSAPSAMDVTTQPTSGRTGSTLGSIKVSIKDAFGYVVVADNSTNVTITVPGRQRA